MKTRAQAWSQMAYQHVSKVKDNKDLAKKYKTACMKMPGLIHQSGLLQALVFQAARGDEAAKDYVDHVAQTYFPKVGATADRAASKRLISHAQALELGGYMALTNDVAEIATWFRRFAQIELGSED